MAMFSVNKSMIIIVGMSMNVRSVPAKTGAAMPEALPITDRMPLARVYCSLGTMVVTTAE